MYRRFSLDMNCRIILVRLYFYAQAVAAAEYNERSDCMVVRKEAVCPVFQEDVTLELKYLEVPSLHNTIHGRKLISFTCLERLQLDCRQSCPFDNEQILESL